MLRQDVVTTTMRVLDIIRGQPPKVLLARLATRPDGKQRMITLKLDVPDINLSSRLLSEISKGDEIGATVVTDWTDQGYSTHLSGYSKVSETGSTKSRDLAEVVKT
jgi:hypothetical protein